MKKVLTKGDHLRPTPKTTRDLSNLEAAGLSQHQQKEQVVYDDPGIENAAAQLHRTQFRPQISQLNNGAQFATRRPFIAGGHQQSVGRNFQQPLELNYSNNEDQLLPINSFNTLGASNNKLLRPQSMGINHTSFSQKQQQNRRSFVVGHQSLDSPAQPAQNSTEATNIRTPFGVNSDKDLDDDLYNVLGDDCSQTQLRNIQLQQQQNEPDYTNNTISGCHNSSDSNSSSQRTSDLASISGVNHHPLRLQQQQQQMDIDPRDYAAGVYYN